MIANAANRKDDNIVLPAFAHILKQLGKDDVLFLEALFDTATERTLQRILGKKTSGLRPPSEFTYDELLNTFKKAGLSQDHGDFKELSLADKGAYGLRLEVDAADLSIVMSNVTRLGLIEREEYPRLLYRKADYAHGPAKDGLSDVETVQSYSFTNFGIRFVTVCRPPSGKSPDNQPSVQAS